MDTYRTAPPTPAAPRPHWGHRLLCYLGFHSGEILYPIYHSYRIRCRHCKGSWIHYD